MTPPDPITTDDATHATAPPRCSTAEREQTCQALHEAAGEGRLSMEETEERLGQAYAARYRRELAALTADLPAAEPPHGWHLIAATARHQVLHDFAVLTGRAPGDRTRLVAVLLVIVAVALFGMAALAFLLHGIVPEGLEYGRGFD
ncbi:MAG: DUF1707 domain-containing protein [Pseudonocardia sp.]|nr:DUF1707 domain-containing protein [Pseudonocardia sp.]